ARSIWASGRCSISVKCCRIRAGSVMAPSSTLRRDAVVGDAAALRRALLAWYRRHRRAFPWRRTPDPYRVWVSEIMLQPPRASVPPPSHERLAARFRDVRALPRASMARVLAAWWGLGYSRRARHLHAAAGIVLREHAGRVPADPEVFGALPG